ncbi:Retinoblastoma-associated protein [Lamellibrachia satsuma]|nr:Retinoblastoma-associated protein [Lamellibrachia satsuma]
MTTTEIVVQSEDCHISDLCDSLKVPTNISSLATDLWSKLRMDNPDDFKSDVVAWYSCLLYISSIDRRLPYGVMDPQAQCGALEYPSVTVTQLLRAAGISIIEFFRKLTEIFRHGHVSDAVLHHQMSLQRKYLVTCPLFHKFKIMFEEIFLREDRPFTEDSDADEVCVDVDTYNDRKKLSWALFVYIKGTTLCAPPELLQSFHLLLCCLLHVMSNTPLFQLKPPYDGVKLDSSEGDNGLLTALCENYHVCIDEVKSLQAIHVTPFIESIEQQHRIVAVDVVVKLCQLQYRQLGDIDEMLFLEDDPQLMTTTHRNEGAETVGHGIHGNNSTNQAPVTPIRAAVTSVRQLKSLLTAVTDELSPNLRQHFSDCVLDPTHTIEERNRELGDKFVTRWTQLQGDTSEQTARQRWQLAVRLYYVVLEKLVAQEKNRVPQQDLSLLLLNAVFHKCLLICAVEVVMATYRTPWVSLLPEENYAPSEDCEGVVFPWILTVFDVTPFDVIKVLESFVTAESCFSKDIVKHLQHIENRILDSLAWQAGSPLFDQLTRCEVSLLPITPPTDRTHSGSFVCPSPVRFRAGTSLIHGMSPSTTPDTSPASPRHRALSASLNMFFNKVCRLAHHRMLALCGLLGIPKDVIVMCSIYAVCKVAHTEIKFKTIVAMYRTLLHAGHHMHRVYKQVLVMPGEFDTIIAFY